MDRTQFTFYDSFFKAIRRIKRKSDRCDAYDAICNYALHDILPDLEELPDAVAIAFELSKPNLDASRRKASSGRKGGSAKQSRSKPEANEKQEQDESKKEIEDENKNKIEHECDPPTPFAIVLSAFRNKINPTPSEASICELKGFVEQMGAECCLRAINTALDAGADKANWLYIRGILRSKLRQGVRCLADWDKLEEARVQRVPIGKDSMPSGNVFLEMLEEQT